MKNKNEIMSISEAIIDYLQREHCGKALAVKATELQRRFGVTPRQLRTIVSSARCEIIPICSDGNGYYFAESAEEIARTRAMIRAQAISMLNAARGLDKAYEAFGKSNPVS